VYSQTIPESWSSSCEGTIVETRVRTDNAKGRGHRFTVVVSARVCSLIWLFRRSSYFYAVISKFRYVVHAGVIFMPCDNKQPIRYLMTLNRHDTVKQLRSQLIAALDEDDSFDLIIAEVFDNHIARVLVSLTPLCACSRHGLVTNFCRYKN